MPEVCGNIKTELEANHNGLTALAQLIAIYTSAGIVNVSDIAKRTGYSDRAIRKAKAELGCRNPGADGGTPVPEPGCHTGTPVPKRNPGAGTPVPEPSRAHATNELPTEVLIESKLELASSREDISETMITDIVSWSHGGDRITAGNWLSSTIKIFGQDATSAAYAKLKTDLLTGCVIARKLPAWTAIAQRMKASPPATPNVVTFRPATDTSGRPLPSVAEVMAQIRAEAAHAAG